MIPAVRSNPVGLTGPFCIPRQCPLICVRHGILLRPRRTGWTQFPNKPDLPPNKCSRNTFTRSGRKPQSLFRDNFLKHLTLEILAAVSFFFYPDENQFQVSRPPRFNRLQTQENPSKHFSAAARREGQICVCICNDCSSAY